VDFSSGGVVIVLAVETEALQGCELSSNVAARDTGGEVVVGAVDRGGVIDRGGVSLPPVGTRAGGGLEGGDIVETGAKGVEMVSTRVCSVSVVVGDCGTTTSLTPVYSTCIIPPIEADREPLGGGAGGNKSSFCFSFSFAFSSCWRFYYRQLIGTPNIRRHHIPPFLSAVSLQLARYQPIFLV